MVSRNWLVVMALLVHPTSPASPAHPAPIWREAPDLGRLFTPQQVPPRTYRVYTSDVSLEEALAQIRSDPAMASWPDAWTIERRGPADAFGQGASYDRWTVARLYGATTARVARGPRMESGQPVEMWTLISPHPSAALDRLERGTLLVVLNLR